MNRLLPLSLLLVSLFTGACSRRPGYYLDKGNSLAAAGKYEDAIINYRKVIAADPRNGEAYYRLGSTLLQARRVKEAYQALSRAGDLLPGRDDVAVKLADLTFSAYLSDKNRPKFLYDKVLALSNRLLARNMQSYDGLRLKANLAATDKRLKDAEDLYRSANQSLPMQPATVFAWAEVLFADNQPGEAETLTLQLIAKNKTYGPAYDLLYTYYERAGRLSDAEKILRTRIDNNPSDSSAFLELAAFYAGASREADMQSVIRRMLNNPGAFPQAHLEVGDLYARMHRWDAALAEYDQGSKSNPGERIAYLKKTADLWLAQGKPAEAEKFVDQILAAHPADEGALAIKASLLLDSRQPGKVATAVTDFKALVDKHPDDTGLRFSLGRGLAVKGDQEGARFQFLEAVKRRPDQLPPRVALLELSQAQGDYKSALQQADQILAMNPGMPRIRLMRVASLVNAGRETEARTEITNLERALPGNKDVRLQAAALDLHEKKFGPAEAAFSKLVTEDGRDPRPLAGLIETLLAQKQTDKALSVLDGQLKKISDSLMVRSMLATTAAAAGRYDLAIAQYRQVLAAAPTSEPAFLAVGSVLQLKGDLPGAISSFQKAHSLNAADPEPILRLGVALSLAGRNSEALDNFRQALKLKPDDPSLMSNTAYLMAESGQSLDEALTLAQQAVHRSSQQPNFADTLGWVYFKKRQSDSAAQVFRSLTEKYPENATFHYHFGKVLEGQGDRSGARTEFAAALAAHPSDEIRRNTQAALSR